MCSSRRSRRATCSPWAWVPARCSSRRTVWRSFSRARSARDSHTSPRCRSRAPARRPRALGSSGRAPDGRCEASGAASCPTVCGTSTCGSTSSRGCWRCAAASERATNVDRAISELANRLDADLWLYQDGVLTATSAPVLDELGLADPFLAPDVFVRLALRDELEVSADGSTAGRPVRVGYRVVVAGAPRAQAILAAPQLVDDERVRQPLEDLTLALVLAILVGLVAAVTLAGVVARGLASPVAALRDAAAALGQRGSPCGPRGASRRGRYGRRARGRAHRGARVRRGGATDPGADCVARAFA